MTSLTAVAGSVGVLSINSSGALSPISGSPFVIDGNGENSNVAILDPREKLLFVSNQNTDSITVLNVAVEGSLTLVPGSPFKVFGNGFPAGMATTGNGSFFV